MLDDAGFAKPKLTGDVLVRESARHGAENLKLARSQLGDGWVLRHHAGDLGLDESLTSGDFLQGAEDDRIFG